MRRYTNFPLLDSSTLATTNSESPKMAWRDYISISAGPDDWSQSVLMLSSSKYQE
jgi:hypothetical protein